MLHYDAGPYDLMPSVPMASKRTGRSAHFRTHRDSYTLNQPRELCKECGRRPATTQGPERPFCSIICAERHSRRSPAAATMLPQNFLCRGCGLYPQAVVAGIQQTHCSKDCARKWPITPTVCAFKGCHTQISGAFGAYCSVAHLNRASPRHNILQKTHMPSTVPQMATQPQGHFGINPFRLFGRSNIAPRNPGRILFYDKHAPHYGFTNFSDHSVVYFGKKYPTSEHLFQSFKFQEHRPDIARHIRKCSNQPSVALAEARRYEQEVRPDWSRVNIEKMDITLWHKFTQHRELEAELLATGDAELVEASPTDAFWGVGHDGKGRNELGKALMRLRARLRAT